MRFARHLIAHLTPEWRKHYIRYDDLKKQIYAMIKKEKSCTDKGEDQVLTTVDVYLQDEFFEDIEDQLDTVESFYRLQEAKLSYTLRELQEEVTKYEVLCSKSHTKNARPTRRKKQNLKLLLSEYYLNVSLLQNYQQLNHTGFRKILKKYDKLAQSTRGKTFFKERVCQNYFWKSHEIPRLIELTETLMIEKVEGGNRSKAMNTLRVPPLESRDIRSQWVPLRAGWLMGLITISFFVLVLGYVFRPRDSWDHVSPTIHGLRVGLLLTIWFYGFAINTRVWRKNGVNSVLIFEFNPRDNLNFVELFEVASAVGVIFIIGVYFTVFSYWLNMPEWAGPVIMLSLIFIFIVNPLPILYSSSRRWLLKKLGRIALAPFFSVEFADFWIADQMNSLSVVLLDVETFLCYILLDLTIPGDNIQCASVRYGLRPIVAALPAWFRFAQCLRRYYDTRQAFPHLVNAGKYSTSFFVIFFGSLASGIMVEGVEVQSAGYYIVFVLWVIAHIVSSTYTFTWDVRVDWGLFEGPYKLRSELIYSHKIYYVLAVIEDLIFRSLWTLNISLGSRGSQIIEGSILGTVLAMLEVLRRFIWNIFRLENEHLNNVGAFRAVRDISIRPVDLSNVDNGEEDDDLVPSNSAIQLSRRVSYTLSQLAPGATKPRQRKSSLMTLAAGINPIAEDFKARNSPQISRLDIPVDHTHSTGPPPLVENGNTRSFSDTAPDQEDRALPDIVVTFNVSEAEGSTLV